jgi:hypothetical protein
VAILVLTGVDDVCWFMQISALEVLVQRAVVILYVIVNPTKVSQFIGSNIAESEVRITTALIRGSYYSVSGVRECYCLLNGGLQITSFDSRISCSSMGNIQRQFGMTER